MAVRRPLLFGGSTLYVWLGELGCMGICSFRSFYLPCDNTTSVKMAAV